MTARASSSNFERSCKLFQSWWSCQYRRLRCSADLAARGAASFVLMKFNQWRQRLNFTDPSCMLTNCIGHFYCVTLGNYASRLVGPILTVMKLMPAVHIFYFSGSRCSTVWHTKQTAEKTSWQVSTSSLIRYVLLVCLLALSRVVLQRMCWQSVGTRLLAWSHAGFSSSLVLCQLFFPLLRLQIEKTKWGSIPGAYTGGVHRCQWTPLEVSSFVSKSTACALTACEHVFAIDHGRVSSHAHATFIQLSRIWSLQSAQDRYV